MKWKYFSFYGLSVSLSLPFFIFVSAIVDAQIPNEIVCYGIVCVLLYCVCGGTFFGLTHITVANTILYLCLYLRSLKYLLRYFALK